MKISSVAAVEVVMSTTSGATIGESFVKTMTVLFLWLRSRVCEEIKMVLVSVPYLYGWYHRSLALDRMVGLVFVINSAAIQRFYISNYQSRMTFRVIMFWLNICCVIYMFACLTTMIKCVRMGYLWEKTTYLKYNRRNIPKKHLLLKDIPRTRPTQRVWANLHYDYKKIVICQLVNTKLWT